MLEYENFSNQKFEDILDLAKKKISSIDSEWTNMQEPDPGITLLEMFAWLKEIQVRYMKYISPNTLYQFLKLLNIKSKYNKGSKILINVGNIFEKTLLPKGTKWVSGEMVFENEKEQCIVPSKINNISFENPEWNIDEKLINLDGKRAYFLFGENFVKNRKSKRNFIIHFDKAIPKNIEFNLFFNIVEIYEGKRNPIKPEDDFIEMANISWQYYGIQDGNIGWHDIEVNLDDTHNFLFSGLITLKIPNNGEMVLSENGYDIRAVLNEQSYDFPPMINDIKINVFQVTQKETVCENNILKKKDLLGNDAINIYTHLALYGKFRVYLKEKSGSWIETTDFTFERKINEGNTRFFINKLNKHIKDLNEQDDAVMIVAYSKDLDNKTEIGSGTGISLQKIPFKCKNILYEDFNLIIGKKSGDDFLYDKWKKVEIFHSSSKYDKHYILDWERDQIVFGDNEMGQAPRKGNGNIRLMSLVYTNGKQSNIKAGMINNVISENPAIISLDITQINNANGGRDSETFDEVQRKPVDIFDEVDRAVTISDYEKIVRSTPGLIIENVKVLPNYLPDGIQEEMNCVTVAIQQGEPGKESYSLNSYRNNIIKHFEKYRLINTKVEVTGPSYVGLKIRGEIVLNTYKKECEKEIENKIRLFIKKLNKNLGRSLHFGDLFGTIEQMDSVIYLEKLNIIPSGDYIEKTKSDDIIVKPNGAYYIESIKLDYIRNNIF